MTILDSLPQITKPIILEKEYLVSLKQRILFNRAVVCFVRYYF